MKIFQLLVLLSFTLKAQSQILSAEEQLVSTCVQITTKDKRKKSSGTAFFMNFQDSLGNSITALVTNKHVVENADTAEIKFNLDVKGKPDYGNAIPIRFTNFEDQWIMHPKEEIDLCIMPLSKMLEITASNGINLHIRTIPMEFIPVDSVWNDITILDEVIMIGYPIGLSDTYNNTAIARTGSTATLGKLDYEGKPYFLIDIAAFPGSSGSPVFRRRTVSVTKEIDNGVSIGTSFRYDLLGILFAGPMISNLKGEITMATPTESLAIGRIPLNLGIIIKSTELKAFRDLLFK